MKSFIFCPHFSFSILKYRKETWSTSTIFWLPVKQDYSTSSLSSSGDYKKDKERLSMK